MRAIDGDALRDKLQNLADDEWNQSTTTSWAEAFYACADIVADAPTIEPERKTGKWIDETFKPWGLVHHPYKCDQCGEHSETDSDFCPNCGAKMEGEG